MRLVTALSLTCIVASAALVPTTTRARSSFVPVAASSQPPAVAREAPLTLLSVCGRALCAGNTRFPWRGVTAFGLADLVADGRESEARAFVRWARDTGFTMLRVLAMIPNGGWIDLSPADGRRALPRVFAMARDHGMYVQVVALANTNERSGRYRSESFLREQVREVGRLCAAAGNCVLELANEPYHGSQARLDNPSLMLRLQREVRGHLPVAWGAAASDRSSSMAGGTFVVVHVGRSGDRWTRIAGMRSLAALSASTGKFVVDNEPIGAAESPQRNRRDSAPEVFFAQSVLARLLDVGSTFHCEDCLRARTPGPIQQRCAEGFVEGSRIMPDDIKATFADDGSPSAPATLADSTSGRVFSAVAGDRAWTLILGDGVSPTLRWREGWRARRRIAQRPGVEVWTAGR
jgi:hypothetical protein